LGWLVGVSIFTCSNVGFSSTVGLHGFYLWCSTSPQGKRAFVWRIEFYSSGTTVLAPAAQLLGLIFGAAEAPERPD